MKISNLKVSLLMLSLGFGVIPNVAFAQNLNPTINGNTYTFDLTAPSLYNNPTKDPLINFSFTTDPMVTMGQISSYYSLDSQLDLFADIHKCIPSTQSLASLFGGGLATNYNPPSITTCSGIENVQGAVVLEIDIPAITDLTLNVAVPSPNSFSYQVGNQTYTQANAVSLSISLGGTLNYPLVPSCTSSVGQVYSAPDNYGQGGYAEIVVLNPTTANFNTNSLVVNIHCQTPVKLISAFDGGSAPNAANEPFQFAFITKATLGASLPKLQLVATALDANENDAQAPVSSNITNGSTISLPLGGLTSLQLQDSSGNPLTATYQLSGTPTFNSSAPPVDVVNGLYLDRLALLFDPGVSTDDQELMPVHLGTQILTITPTDTQYPPISLTLNVIRPSSVGSGVYDCSYTNGNTVQDADYAKSAGGCDALVIDQAHVEGLPPQFIKAEIWQESYNHAFVKNSYRYEPWVDKNSFYNLSKNPKIKYPWINNTALYGKYFLFATSMNTNISAADLHLRSIYKITLDNKTLISIPDNYETSFKHPKYNPLLSWNIVQADYFFLDDIQNWFQNAVPTLDNFNFVAQTVISASYGIMQLMYPTAADTLKYQSGGIGLDPSGLLRPSTNVSYGSKYLSKQFVVINNLEGNNVANPTGENNLLLGLQNSAAGYNGGKNKYKKSSAYAASVIGQTKQYWITQPAVFGN